MVAAQTSPDPIAGCCAPTVLPADMLGVKWMQHMLVHTSSCSELDTVQALDGFSLCLWQLGEGQADTALAGINVFPLLHRLSKETNQLLRRSIITAVGALSHPGQSSLHV